MEDRLFAIEQFPMEERNDKIKEAIVNYKKAISKDNTEDNKLSRNEIVKYLYKNKPIAIYVFTVIEGCVYQTTINNQVISFLIPENERYSDNGKRIITDFAEAQLLIRWLIVDE